MNILFGKYHCLKNKINKDANYDGSLYGLSIKERHHLYGVMGKNSHDLNIWTVIKNGNKAKVLPGYNIPVNRIGHFVTYENRKRFNDEKEEFDIELDENTISLSWVQKIN